MNALVVYWVTSRSSDQHDTVPTTGPDVISPSKPGDPESGGTGPSSKSTKVGFKLGRSKRESPTGLTSMQVIIVRSLLPRSGTLNSPLQIRVTTEQIVEHGESSTNESEYELDKVSSIPNEVREENRSPERKK